MARRSLVSRLLPVGIVGGLGYFLYAKGETDLAKGQTTGLAALSGSLDTLFKGASGSINQSGTGTAPAASQGATTAAGACAILPYGDLGSISRDAQQHGIVSATDTRAIIYGRTWWAINHGGNACSFNQASQADQIVWQSVAINGH